MKVVLLDLLNNDSNMEAFDLNYLMTNAYNNVWVLGSVNGLICLAIEFTNLFIWNPSIRKFKTSLESRSRDKPFCFKYGFGCDDSLDDYKVVDMFCYKYGSSHHIEMVKIYSLKSDYQKMVDEDFSGVTKLPSLGAMWSTKTWKFVNRRISEANSYLRDLHKEQNIVSIDLADE